MNVPNAAAETRRPQVTFRVGEERYGVDLDAVQEIVRADGRRPAADAPSFVRGTVPVRAASVPVVDLRERLETPGTAPSAERRVLIARGTGGARMGLIVDSVDEVAAIADGEVESVPERFRDARRVVRGLVDTGQGLVSLLDVEALLSPGEWRALAAFAAGEEAE